MNKIQNIYLTLFIVLLMIVGFYVFVYERETVVDDDDDIEISQAVYQQGIVHLSIEAQQAADVAIKQAEKAEYQLEHKGIGYVMDVDALMVVYEQLNATRHALNLSDNALKASTNELQRVVLLNKEHSNVTARRYDEAKRQYQEDFIHSKNLEKQISAIKNKLRRNWGEQIADWFFADNPAVLEQLLNGELLLVHINLDDEIKSEADLSRAFINSSSNRQGALPASYVGRSLHSEIKTQKQGYIYSLQADRLRVGMRLYAWVPSQQFMQGVNIEADAVVWHENKPWFYIKQQAELFKRVEIQDHHLNNGYWFLPKQDMTNQEYVSQGAQILLSEEFRWRIPDEDDDDP